jgi:hypothetical protein
MPKPRFLTALVLTLVVALAAGLLLGRASGGGQRASAEPSPPSPAPSGPSSDTPEPAGSQPQSAPQPQPQPAPQPQPQPQPEPKAGPGVLLVLPEHIALPKGQWTAQFTVANVGESEMAWFAVGVPSTVALSATQGVLAPGAETTVSATVDHTKLAEGPFSLKLHVSANDTARSVTITGTKQIKVAVPLGPNGLKLG